jgi:3-oxoacyl-[acyl-carrier protein] reductase
MKLSRLTGKTAVVTGSGQNIGRAIAELFVAEGANVVVNGSSNKTIVDEVVDSLRERGGNAIGVMADVSDPEQVKRLIETAEGEFGRVDIAVNNVSVREKISFEDLSIDDWHRIIRINLHSAFYMSHYLLPRLREQGWGRIVHISGVDGFFGVVPNRAANITAKAGMHGLSKAIALEYGQHGVTANTVAVGAINTARDWSQYDHVDMAKVAEAIPSKSFGEPADIAEACLYLASDSGKFVNGQVVHVNGGQFMV